MTGMARKPRVFIESGIYHVTCRGNDRRNIFKGDGDRIRFLERLEESAQTYEVRIYLYCLMSNHVHLLVETPHGNLDRFMGSLLTGYTVYFNRRHNRAGHLMQGRYGAQVVEGTEYLLKLSRYIHLNPVHVKECTGYSLREKISYLHRYVWSSFQEYAGLATGRGFLCAAPVYGLLEGMGRGRDAVRYRRYVEAGLAQTDEQFLELMKGNGVAVGSESFVDEIKQLHQSAANERRRSEDISFRQLRRFKTADEVKRGVEKVLGASAESWMPRRAGAVERGFYAWALQHYAGLTQREVAGYFEVGTGAAICLSIKRFAASERGDKWRETLNLIFKG